MQGQSFNNGVVRALRSEWSSRWSSSETGGDLREVFPRVGDAWTTLDAARGSGWTTLIVAQFLVGHCHMFVFLHRKTQMGGCLPVAGMISYAIILFGHARGCSRMELSF